MMVMNIVLAVASLFMFVFIASKYPTLGPKGVLLSIGYLGVALYILLIGLGDYRNWQAKRRNADLEEHRRRMARLDKIATQARYRRNWWRE